MISVVIPAYNEEASIGKMIDEILSIMKKEKIDKNSEIIVVNDGSKDKTKEEVLKKKVVLINNPCNMGYGYSLKKGIEKAKNETIVIIDADFTYPFSSIKDLLKEKEKGFDLVVGARTGKYYKESVHKNILRKFLKKFVEFVCGKKIKDVNSGFRVFDKTTIMRFFPRLCDTFSFTTSQTLAYFMNSLTVCYVDIPYNKRIGKTKIKLFRDSLISIKYILKSGVYYNPFKIFAFLSLVCLFLSVICFIVSHFLHINAGYILGISCILLSVIEISLGILATLLKEIMDK